MKEILLSQHSKKNRGKFVALVDDEDYEWLNKDSWYAHRAEGRTKITDYYVKNSKKIGNKKVKITLMHRLIMNAPKGVCVDHIDRNPFNNQRSNLRFATYQQNAFNKSKITNKTSIYLGVYLNKKAKINNREKIWLAKIKLNSGNVHLGSFKTEIDAAKAYNEMALKHFGEFANLNIF